MEKQRAINLLNDTFNSHFNINRFAVFVKELFNNFNVDVKTWTVWKEYLDYIESYRLLGSYKDNSKKAIDVLVVKLKRTGSRDRARTMQRNFVAKYLSNAEKEGALVAFYGDDIQDWRFSFVKMDYNLVKDESGKVIVAKELTPAKRYSFLVGVNEPNHTCRRQFLELVMQEEINPTIEEIESAFSIDNVTKEFFNEYKELFLELEESLQKVIKKDDSVKEEFESKGISTVDFAKKLLGQIVFIYFLQKKGWLGVKKGEKWGDGPKDFMRYLFGGGQRNLKPLVPYKNFFNEILEPLFYEALATDRSADDHFYRLFNCKIPFLNGGLFEPINEYKWAEIDIVIDNAIFDRILSTFDRFNFTVKEDEPLEKEVAVDPEMLGKVFENLLEVKDRKSKGAFYTPRKIVHYMCQQSLINYLETNTSISRKDIEKFIQLGDLALASSIRVLQEIDKKQEKLKKGIISADIFEKEVKEELEKLDLPKSIVENYKEIDKLLKEIKIVDPAVGSGAFPVGMMNEIIKARSILSIYFSEKRSNYDLKREIIENCLYGVDIESSAVEITKLRFWLSLIVDELDMQNIKPLPNLDHKIMCGNSLLEEFEGVKLFDEKLLGEVEKDVSFEVKQIDKEIAELYKKKGDIVRGKSNGDSVKEVEKEIKKLENKKQKLLSAPKDTARNLTLDEAMQHRIKESQKKLAELKKLQDDFFNAENRNLKKQLRDKIDKIEWELIEETLKEQGNLEAMQKLEQYKKNKTKPFFLWKLHFSEVFTRENPGFDVVIANPPYVKEYINRNAFDGLRDSPYYKGKMDLWYFFACKSIDLLRKEGVLTFIAQNNWVTSYGSSVMRNKVIQETKILNLIDFSDYKIFDTSGIQTMIMIFKKERDTNNYSIDIRKLNYTTGVSFNEILDILSRRINSHVEYLLPNINRTDFIDSIITFSNSYFSKIFDKIKQKGNYYLKKDNVAQGIVCPQEYVINSHIEVLGNSVNKGEGIFTLKKEEIDKLKLTQKEKEIIKPFFTTEELFRYYKCPKNKLWVIYSDMVVRKNIKNYPNIKEHLDKFKKVITSDFAPYGLHRAREQNFFEGEKIISLRKTSKPSFTYTDFPCYVSQTYFVIKPQDINLKYLTSLLNSKLIEFWFKNKGKMQGNIYQIDKEPLLSIPILKILDIQQKPFVQLVDQILSITKDADYLDNPDKQAKVKRLEKEIDQLVYKLYELTPEEIKIVEEFNEG